MPYGRLRSENIFWKKEKAKEDVLEEIDFEAKKDLLDTIIAEELNDYYILELGHVSPENRYLNEKDQMDLIGKITAKVFVNRKNEYQFRNNNFIITEFLINSLQ